MVTKDYSACTGRQLTKASQENGRPVAPIFAKNSGGGGGKYPLVSYLQAKCLASNHNNSGVFWPRREQTLRGRLFVRHFVRNLFPPFLHIASLFVREGTLQ